MTNESEKPGPLREPMRKECLTHGVDCLVCGIAADLEINHFKKLLDEKDKEIEKLKINHDCQGSHIIPSELEKVLEEKEMEIRAAHDVVQIRDRQIEELVEASKEILYWGLDSIRRDIMKKVLAKHSSTEKK